MANPVEDPFEAFRKKKKEEEDRKKRDEEAEAEGSAETKTGDPPKKEFIMTRLLRKVSKKGKHHDEPRPEGFDDHRFEGTKHGEEAEAGEKPHGMRTDRMDGEDGEEEESSD